MAIGSWRGTQTRFTAVLVVPLLAWCATAAGAQSARPGEAVRAPGSPTRSAAGVVVIPGRPRRAEDRPLVILLDEVREPAAARQPELALGVDPERNVRFVHVSAQGLVPPPAIQIVCRQLTQALPLSSSSRDADRVTGAYELSAALAPRILAAEGCLVALGSAFVAIPSELARGVWGEEAAGMAGGGTADRAACAAPPAAAQVAEHALSPSARPAAAELVARLAELSAWANGSASKSRTDYLARLARIEEAAAGKPLSAALASDARLAGVVSAALGCFRQAARAWPDVNAPWAMAEQNVRAAERSLGPAPPGEQQEEARPPAPESRPAQAARAAKPAMPTARAAGPGGAVREASATTGKAALVKLPFNGSDYVHRWSKDGKSEFTPPGEEDLGAWKSMVTIIVYDGVRTGDDLAAVANRVLGAYQANGKVLKVDSRPRTSEREAEHFMAVVLGNPELLEAVFARFLLVERTGVAVLYARRIYGQRIGDDMSAWLARNGSPFEEALMSWKGMPALGALRALPQAR